MNYKINKELFEAVMDFKVDNVSITTVYANIDAGLRYERKETLYTIVDCISIDSFFFKCKEWAFWNDYEIIVRMRIVDIYRDEHKIDYGYEINHTNNGIIKTSWWISSEQQVVFDACQWILDNKEK